MRRASELRYFLPHHELLRKHIVCYHLSNYEEKPFEQEFLIYPHYLHTVTLHHNFSTTFSYNLFTYQEPKAEKFNLNILGRFTKPILCKLDGCGKALTIVFKPTGINFFCDRSFDVLVPNGVNHFPYWNDKAGELEGLLYINDVSQTIKKLEEILLSFYRPFQNRILFETLSLLHSNYGQYNVKEVEQTLNINRKTLLRQFKKHIGVSLTDYRRILRFRDAIKRHSTSDGNLTRLAYETCFSDQSHFIKDVQKLTGDSPKKLLKEACSVKDAPFFLKTI